MATPPLHLGDPQLRNLLGCHQRRRGLTGDLREPPLLKACKSRNHQFQASQMLSSVNCLGGANASDIKLGEWSAMGMGASTVRTHRHVPRISGAELSHGHSPAQHDGLLAAVLCPDQLLLWKAQQEGQGRPIKDGKEEHLRGRDASCFSAEEEARSSRSVRAAEAQKEVLGRQHKSNDEASPINGTNVPS